VQFGGVLVRYDAGSSARMERATRRQLQHELKLVAMARTDGKRKGVGLQALATPERRRRAGVWRTNAYHAGG
jgi:hypothetical protein